MKKTTRRSKYIKNPSGPKGKSKYALKVAKRQKYAASFGLTDTPWPVLLHGLDIS